MKKYDFSGYATKNDLKCADGRVIRQNAFKDNDGSVVPLVWQHLHDEPENVLGHAVLENRNDGVYAYCTFNESQKAQDAKILVKHGDISSMSIFANRLKQDGPNVTHGIIREVSLVLAGANPGARIENLSFAHGDGTEDIFDDQAMIYSDIPLNAFIQHADSGDEEKKETKEETNEQKEDDMADGDKTVEDVFNSMTDEQKEVVYFLVGQAVEDNGGDEEEEVEHSAMKYNVFDNYGEEGYYEEDDNVLTHSDLMAAVDIAKSGSNGSLKDAIEDVLQHSIEEIDILFPEAQLVNPTPEMIARPNAWVSEVWNGLKKSPFARIKSTAANITADEARARGYIKGKQKKEEVIKLLKRVTTPQTVYKLQKMDRDDVIDITSFDVIAWLKAEMRLMLDEELARAVLVGDGRGDESEDKINEINIRPIYQDADLYTIHKQVELKDSMDETDKSNALIDAALRARKDYMGSGNPAMYASTDVINDMLLAKDRIGRRLYSTVAELADALRVSKIVEVPILEGATREDKDNEYELLFLIVNLGDYTVGADKGGAVNMFEDFNLDFNKHEYLIETRCSGALTKPYSAIALEKKVTTSPETPETPETPKTPEIEG